MATSAEANLFSSSLNTTLRGKYHVFLNFRGEDTRKGFTDHLYAALWRKGIITFKDDEELEKGEVISQELLQAVEESLSAIVILSQNYASSTWCLDELQKILESRKRQGMEVFPVFYNVDPSDVRHQRGSFADAFQKHKERFKEDKEKVQRWREALEEVANISGYNSMGWHETKLIEDIVEEVWTKIQPQLPSYNNGLVGIDSRMEDMNSLLRIGWSDVRLIGIWGMGGIGKTTLARIIYERICGQFDISCFLADVRDISKSKGLVHLQEKLISKLKLRGVQIDDSYQGKKIIRNLLCNKRVLVVLDDVSEIDQLENLAIKQGWFGQGSRVIVTTRHMHLLTSHGDFLKYEAKFLDNDESLKLFCQRAFKRDKPLEGYLKLSKSVIELARGLPLTLEVLGSHLCGRSILEWEIALDKIKKVPPEDILKRLRISYEALDYMEKKILLDIACFFKGMTKDQVTQILEICDLYPTIGIKELIEKSLLTEYSEHGTWCIGMHDILQEMCKNIVFQESPGDASKRSRLWSQEDIHHVLTKSKGSELIEIIHLQSSKPYEAHWDIEAFSKMCNLRILIISCDVNLPFGLKCLSSSLRILDWKRYPLKRLPISFHLNELVDLKLHYSKIKELWKGKEPLKKLRFMDLSYSEDLIQTPNFSMLPNLEQLVLQGCKTLVEVDASLGQHKKLVVVNLKDCKSLKALPKILEMDSLKDFILSGCFKLKKLPEFGENMNNLSMIDLKNCKNLGYLPSSIRNLKFLKSLNIFGCSEFRWLPNNLNENECLEELDVSGTAIRELPSSILALQNLKALYLNGCRGQASNSSRNLLSCFQSSHGVPSRLMLPPSISSLSSLKELDLSYCNLSVGSIPDDLGCLPSLEVLDLSGNNFGDLPTGSSVLPPSFSSLTSLRTLGLSYCNLHDGSISNDFRCLPSLSIVRLSGNNFTKPPASCVSNLLPLRVLILSHSRRLQSLPDLPPNVKHKNTNDCCSKEPLPFSEQLWNFIASTDFQVSFPHSLSFDTQFVIWSTPGNEIPSWFHKQNFQHQYKISGFRDKHYVEVPRQSFQDKNDVFWAADSIVLMKVDISQFCGSSERWGICVCLVVQDTSSANSKHLFDCVIWLTSKASGDEFFQDEIGWVMPMECNFPQLFIMFLPCNDVKADCNHIELVVYTSRYPKKGAEAEVEGKANNKSHGRVIISKCGWRVTCKEDVQEWRRATSEHKSSNNISRQ